VKRPIIPEREKFQTSSAVQGSLLLILRNSKFGVLVANLVKLNFKKEEDEETNTKNPTPWFLCYSLPEYLMNEVTYSTL
jgi:hypothetical protein